MICDIQQIPSYINNLDVSDKEKQDLRNLHYSAKAKLENLTYLADSGFKRETISGKEYVTTTRNLDNLNSEFPSPVYFTKDLDGHNVVGIDVSQIKNNNNYFNISDYTDLLINQDTETKVRKYADLLGVSIEKTDDLIEKYGIKGLADMAKKQIQFITGAESSLPEEVAHFQFASLPKNSPIYQEAMSQITGYDLYSEVLKEYSSKKDYQNEDGSPNIEKIKEEAAGKLIAQQIYRINQNIPLSAQKVSKEDKPLNWLQRIIAWWKGRFNELFKDDVFAKLAQDILTGNTSNLTEDYVKADLSAKGIFLDASVYQKLSDYLAKKDINKLVGNIQKAVSVISNLRNKVGKEEDLRREYNSKVGKEDKIESSKEVSTLLGDLLKDINSLKTESQTSSPEELSNIVEGLSKTYFGYITEAHKMYYDYSNIMDSVSLMPKSTPVERAQKILEFDRIITSVIQLDSVNEEFNKITQELPFNNPLRQKIGEMMQLKERIHQAYYQNMIDIVPSTLWNDVFINAYANAKMLKEKDTQHLKDYFTLGVDEKGRKLSAKDIETARKNYDASWEQFEKTAPSEDKLRAIIQGDLGDSGLLHGWFSNALSNPDLVISGLAKYVEEKLYDSRKYLISVENKFQTAQDKLLRETGLSINNDRALSDPITEEVTVILGKDEKGEPIPSTQLWLLSPVDPKFKLEQDNFDYQISNALAARKLSKTPEEYEKLTDEIKEIKKKFSEWRKVNMESPYTEEFYELTSELLDKELTDSKGNKFTVREQTADIWNDIDKERKAFLGSSSSKSASDHWDKLQNLEIKLKELRIADTKPEGSKEYITAKQLEKYYANQKLTTDFELTPDSYDRWEALKALYTKKLNDSDNPDEKANIQLYLDSFTTRAYTKTFKLRREKLTNEINTLIETAQQDKESYQSKEINQLKEKLEKASTFKKEAIQKDLDFKSLTISQLYKKIKTLSSPAREEGIINGNSQSLTEDRVQLIKQYQERIEFLKQKTLNVEGDTKANKIRRAELKAKNNTLTQQRNSPDADIDRIDEEIDRNNSELLQLSQKNTLLSKPQIEHYYKLVAELASMTKSVETEEYKNKTAEIINQIKADMPDIELPDTFISDGLIEYVKGEDEYVAKDNPEIILPLEQVQDLLKTKQALLELPSTEWYKANHYETIKFITNPFYDGEVIGSSKGEYQTVQEPLYIWKRTEVTNPADKEDQPSFKFYERKIKPEFVNRDPLTGKPHNEDIQGYNSPKPGKYVNQKYKDLETKSKTDSKAKAHLEHLQFLTDFYTEQQRLIDNPNLRPGLKLPSYAKSMFEDLMDSKDLKTFVKDSLSRIRRSITETSQDKDSLYGDYGTFEDDMLSELPVLYRGDIDINLQLRDATKLILLFTAHSVQRNQLSQARPLANALLKLSAETDLKAPKPTDKLGKVSTWIKDKIKPGDRSTQHTVISEFFKSNFLFENEKPLVIAGYDLNKITNNFLHFSSMSILGGRIISPIKNFLTGVVNLSLENTLHPDTIGDYNMVKAARFIAQNKGHLFTDMVKEGNKSFIGQLIQHFDILQGNFIDEYGHNIDWSKEKYFSNISNIVMSPKNLLEYDQHLLNGISILYGQQGDYMGKKIPLIECYELKNGLISLKDGVTLIKSEYQTKEYIARVNSVTNGNFRKIDKAVAQKYALLRAAYQFGAFIGPQIQNMYSSSRFNTQTEREEEGFYHATVSSLFKMFKNKQFNIIKNYKMVDKQQQRYQMAVLQQTMTILILTMLFNLGGGTDKDKNKKLKYDYLLAQYLNMIYAVNQEVQTLTPIAGSDNMLQKFSSPFAAFSTLKLLRRTLLAGLATVPGATYTPFFDHKDAFFTKNSGIWSKGDSKFIADLSKLFNIEGAYLDLFAPNEREKRTEAATHINN